MSNWTHVAGIIRIDDVRGNNKSLPDFDKLIGKELKHYDDFKEAETHPERFLPLGSEGSLERSIWINPESCCTAAYTVSIFGDLRDHDDPNAIIDWFKKTCDKFMVRQAVITVENENNGTVIWEYREKD